MASEFLDVAESLRVQLLRSTAHFNANSIIRGIELAIVGALRALQNPGLFTSEHYRIVAYAVFAGIAMRLAVVIPATILKMLLWASSFFVDLERATWDDNVTNGLNFLAGSVLQIPLFLMSLTRYIHPTLDEVEKHATESQERLRAMYFDNLRLYSTHATAHQRKYVLPSASFFAFKAAVGSAPALLVFASGVFLPRSLLVKFLQAYFASRGLMRELLEPYFSRIHFSYDQKKSFFHDREGVLFGFGLCFYVFLRIPLIGVLVYGVAQASTAFLLSKLTDPPPPPAESNGFAQSQTRWTNKQEFFRSTSSKAQGSNGNSH